MTQKESREEPLEGLLQETPDSPGNDAFVQPPRPVRASTFVPPPRPIRASTFGVKEVLSDRLGRAPFSRDTYKYDRIAHDEQIRILRINPGLKNSRIQCILYTIPLGLAPSDPKWVKYTALSYWWGKPEEEPSHSIELSHNSSDGPKWGLFRIRDNLNDALQKLRREKNPTDVWVDAVCIDQGHDEEKKAQVARMHQVYTQASNVCIWLGRDDGKDESTPTALETFEFLEGILDLHNLDDIIAHTTSENAHKWAQVISLMSNKWFTRRWVIQELALSRSASVRYGDREVEWSSFADAIALFMTKYRQIKRESLDPHNLHKDVDARAFGANTIVHATTNLFRKSPDGYVEERLLPLEVLVTSMLLAFEAGEPKDTIFAVLTLANDTQKSELRLAPEYAKSLLDVYTDFIDYCIETSKSLDVLCRAWAPRQPKTRRTDSWGKNRPIEPTWIPWIDRSSFGKPSDIERGRLHGDSIVGKLDRRGQRTYNASSNLKPWYEFGFLNPDDENTRPTRINSGELRDELDFLPGPIARAWTSGIKKLARTSTLPILSSEKSTGQSANGSAKGPDVLAGPSSSRRNSRRNTQSGPKSSPKKHDGTLRVKGLCLGRVDDISDRVSPEGVIDDQALRMGGWDLELEYPEKERQKVPDKLWRTMVVNRGPNGTSAPAWYQRACLDCLQLVYRTGHLSIQKLRGEPRTPSTILSFLDRVQETVFNRRFFTTAENTGAHTASLFGLGPKDVKCGDILCILFGCSVPVVLREMTKGKDRHYQFIGEAFAQGVMEGEVFQDKRPVFPYNSSVPGEDSFIRTFLLK